MPKVLAMTGGGMWSGLGIYRMVLPARLRRKAHLCFVNALLRFMRDMTPPDGHAARVMRIIVRCFSGKRFCDRRSNRRCLIDGRLAPDDRRVHGEILLGLLDAC